MTAEHERAQLLLNERAKQIHLLIDSLSEATGRPKGLDNEFAGILESFVNWLNNPRSNHFDIEWGETSSNINAVTITVDDEAVKLFCSDYLIDCRTPDATWEESRNRIVQQKNLAATL